MKQQLRNSFALLALVLFLATTGLQAQDDVGPEIGTEIKDFVLTDQSGEERRFSELLAEGPAAVVFHRSADW